MTIVAIDHQAIKKRIKDIIEAETTNLFGPDKKKIRQVVVGTPPNKDYKDLSHPALVITNSERWMEESHRGPVINNVKSSVAAKVRYDIILTVHVTDSPAAEAEVDRLWKLLEQRIYDFATLRNVGGTDPLCKDLLFEQVRRIPQMQGQEIDGFRATLALEIDPNG